MTSAVASSLAWLTLFASLALLACGMLLFAVVLLVQIVRGNARRRRIAASAAAAPVLQESLVQFAAGSSDESVIRRYLQTQRQDVAEALLEFQTRVSGGARDRLCGLALDLGLVHEWCEEGASRDVVKRRRSLSRLAFICSYEACRRIAGELLVNSLKDRDEEVRLYAARGLAQTGVSLHLQRVFALALGPNPLTRAVLTEELRRHAMVLCDKALPEVLASDDPDAIRAALEIATAWERAIPLDQLRRYLEHRDREIRVLALRLAPVAAPDAESRAGILRCLGDDDLEVRSLAAIAAGRLKMTESLAWLAQSMRRGPIEVARLAAGALYNIPPAGPRTLEELSSGEPGTARQAARETLGRGKGQA